MRQIGGVRRRQVPNGASPGCGYGPEDLVLVDVFDIVHYQLTHFFCVHAQEL